MKLKNEFVNALRGFDNHDYYIDIIEKSEIDNKKDISEFTKSEIVHLLKGIKNNREKFNTNELLKCYFDFLEKTS